MFNNLSVHFPVYAFEKEVFVIYVYLGRCRFFVFCFFFMFHSQSRAHHFNHFSTTVFFLKFHQVTKEIDSRKYVDFLFFVLFFLFFFSSNYICNAVMHNAPHITTLIYFNFLLYAIQFSICFIPLQYLFRSVLFFYFIFFYETKKKFTWDRSSRLISFPVCFHSLYLLIWYIFHCLQIDTYSIVKFNCR